MEVHPPIAWCLSSSSPLSMESSSGPSIASMSKKCWIPSVWYLMPWQTKYLRYAPWCQPRHHSHKEAGTKLRIERCGVRGHIVSGCEKHEKCLWSADTGQIFLNSVKAEYSDSIGIKENSSHISWSQIFLMLFPSFVSSPIVQLHSYRCCDTGEPSTTKALLISELCHTSDYLLLSRLMMFWLRGDQHDDSWPASRILLGMLLI